MTAASMPPTISSDQPSGRVAAPTLTPGTAPSSRGRQQPGGGQAADQAGQAERRVLGDQHRHHLAGREAEGLQHAEVGPLDEHPAAGRVDNREYRGAQRDQAEQREDQAQQRVPPGHGLLDLLPGGDVLDRAGCRAG